MEILFITKYIWEIFLGINQNIVKLKIVTMNGQIYILTAVRCIHANHMIVSMKSSKDIVYANYTNVERVVVILVFMGMVYVLHVF